MAARSPKPQITDEEIAEQICRDLEFQGQRFRLGEFVGVLDGHVVAVEDTIDDMFRALEPLGPRGRRAMVFKVGPPVEDVIR